MNGSPSSKFLFACGARTCHFPSLRCSEWSGWRRVCVFPSSREPTRRQTLASPSRTAAYLSPTRVKLLRSGRLWLECRPELRNHGVGWMRAVERLRNGGVPPNPVFLHFCSRLKGASKPTQPQVLTVLQWCFFRIGCSLCWGGMRGVFGAMPSVSTRYRAAASSPARA